MRRTERRRNKEVWQGSMPKSHQRPGLKDPLSQTQRKGGCPNPPGVIAFAITNSVSDARGLHLRAGKSHPQNRLGRKQKGKIVAKSAFRAEGKPTGAGTGRQGEKKLGQAARRPSRISWKADVSFGVGTCSSGLLMGVGSCQRC